MTWQLLAAKVPLIGPQEVAKGLCFQSVLEKGELGSYLVIVLGFYSHFPTAFRHPWTRFPPSRQAVLSQHIGAKLPG